MTETIRVRGAFTLAEVLITLAVIGVVAAVTLPTLIHNYRKSVVESKVKKTYALIANAVRMSEAKYGEISEWDTCGTDSTYECSQKILEKYIIPELNFSKICGQDNKDECWTPPYSLSGLTGIYSQEEKAITAILNNGMSLYMWAGFQATPYPHIQIWFDIDGYRKGRNTLGDDVFGVILVYKTSDTEKAGVWMYRLSLKSVEENSVKSCSKDVNSIQTGSYCGGLIQRNNWKIPDDYPVKF